MFNLVGVFAPEAAVEDSAQFVVKCGSQLSHSASSWRWPVFAPSLSAAMMLENGVDVFMQVFPKHVQGHCVHLSIGGAYVSLALCIRGPELPVLQSPLAMLHYTLSVACWLLVSSMCSTL